MVGGGDDDEETRDDRGREKVLPSCALAGLHQCARGFACLARTSSVEKSSCVIKSAPRQLDPRNSLSLSHSLSISFSPSLPVRMRGAGELWLAAAAASAAAGLPLTSYCSGAMWEERRACVPPDQQPTVNASLTAELPLPGVASKIKRYLFGTHESFLFFCFF